MSAWTRWRSPEDQELCPEPTPHPGQPLPVAERRGWALSTTVGDHGLVGSPVVDTVWHTGFSEGGGESHGPKPQLVSLVKLGDRPVWTLPTQP